ncbi:hypothetical protein dqs_0902 [Azoarcus olearius]|nr:hypothetical protein dqs_0902 [Azoarcus olearius]
MKPFVHHPSLAPSLLRGPARRLAAVLLLAPAVALAAPAPWHLWRSTLDGRTHCAQASPGPGWTHERGPYLDLRCSRPAPPPPAATPQPAPQEPARPRAGARPH